MKDQRSVLTHMSDFVSDDGYRIVAGCAALDKIEAVTLDETGGFPPVLLRATGRTRFQRLGKGGAARGAEDDGCRSLLMSREEASIVVEGKRRRGRRPPADFRATGLE